MRPYILSFNWVYTICVFFPLKWYNYMVINSLYISFSQCNVTCGHGYMQLEVFCKMGDIVIPEEHCPSPQPHPVQTCYVDQCERPRWRPEKWSPVSILANYIWITYMNYIYATYMNQLKTMRFNTIVGTAIHSNHGWTVHRLSNVLCVRAVLGVFWFFFNHSLLFLFLNIQRGF